jgi:squalene cyclase
MKLRSLRYPALLLALAATPVLAQVAGSSSEGPHFGKWETRVLAGSGTEVVRLATWSASGKTMLSYDFYIDDCRTLTFTVGWIRAQPADHDLYLKNVATSLQVDKNAIVPYLSTHQLSKGDIATQLTLSQIDDFGAVVEQMERGNKVQIRVPWDVNTRANDIVEDFALKGFSKGLAWTRKTCGEIADQRAAGQPRNGNPLP